jgi:Tfp pilus assembly protein PilF
MLQDLESRNQLSQPQQNNEEMLQIPLVNDVDQVGNNHRLIAIVVAGFFASTVISYLYLSNKNESDNAKVAVMQQEILPSVSPVITEKQTSITVKSTETDKLQIKKSVEKTIDANTLVTKSQNMIDQIFATALTFEKRPTVVESGKNNKISIPKTKDVSKVSEVVTTKPVANNNVKPKLEKKSVEPVVVKVKEVIVPIVRENSVKDNNTNMIVPAKKIVKAVSPVKQVKKKTVVSKKKKAESFYRSALKNIRKNRIEKARDQLNAALFKDETHVLARSTLATLMLRTGETVAAKKLLNNGLALQSDNVQLSKLLATIYLQEKNLTQAIVVLRQGLPEAQKDSLYLAYLAALYQRNKQNKASIQLYQKALVLNPAQSTWWMGLGISFEQLGQRKYALQAYHNAIIKRSLQGPALKYTQSRYDLLKKQLGARTKERVVAN